MNKAGQNILPLMILIIFQVIFLPVRFTATVVNKDRNSRKRRNGRN